MNKLLLVSSVLLLSGLALAQSSSPPPGYAVPPGYREAERQAQELDKDTAPRTTRAQRPNLVQMQRDARELATLAGSIPPDIDLTAKGLLAKDLASRLKKIEKLAKHLRGEISR